MEARGALAAWPLGTPADRRGYLDLVADYGRLLREMLAHTREQAAQGIVLAAPALADARASLEAVRADLPAVVRPAPGRLADEAARAALIAQVDAQLTADLLPALDALIAFIGPDYAAAAPSGVGCAQYPGGEAFYRAQVAALADSALEPDAIHRLGLDALAELEAQKAAIRDRLAPGLDLHAFDRRMRDDPRARAASPADIERRFTACLERLEPLMPRWFGRRPSAPYSVTRANPAVERAMSFGYYQAPTAADPVGRYRYNGARPEDASLLGAAHLIFHELVPGHHHQLSLQAEAAVVHPLQRSLVSMATLEGWAVYASGLGAEMGAMDELDLYGHAVMQGFVAARLVVDTGLNALGWDLGRAAAFLCAHTAEGEHVIRREVLRYATDIPGQALAYGLGARAILDLRSRAQAALGARFDVRGFHDALLARGAYPLPVLDGVIVDWVAEAERAP